MFLCLICFINAQQVGQMFGYTEENKQDFIVEHNGIILAMLVPWSIKHEKSLDLIVEICDVIQKDMATTLSNAFLPIYLHLHLHESEDIKTKGMDFLLSNADNTLYGLLKSDIKVLINTQNIVAFCSIIISPDTNQYFLCL